MLGDDYFKGYISLNGVHIKDGLVKRPRTFAEEGECIVLRWLHTTGLRSPTFECEIRLSKEHALSWNLPFNNMNMGIGALEALKTWQLSCR